MMDYNGVEDNSLVYGKELALFSIPPTNSGVEKIHWVQYQPVSNAGDDGPLEFVIGGNGNQYIDLAQTRLQVKVKVVKGDGKSLEADEHVGPINLFLHSLWSQVEIQLQQKIVSSAGTMYPYKAYIDTLLRYGTNTNVSNLQSQMYYPDASQSINTGDPIEGSNRGLTSRSNLIAESKVLDMEGPLLSDVCQMSRYLLNGIETSIKLWPSKNEFRLMSDVAEAKYKVVITDAKLNLCHITVSPEIVMSQNEILKTTTAKYPFWRSEMKHYALSKGQYYFNKDNMFQGEVPTRMVVCFVSSESMSGNYKQNPFNFQHFNIDNISITVDGENIPGKPLTPKFSENKGQNYMSAYNTLFSRGQNFNQCSGISRRDYASGYTLFVFDLEPCLPHGDYWPILKRGNLKLDIHFEKPLKETVEVVIYATFPDLFEVDSSRAILR